MSQVSVSSNVPCSSNVFNQPSVSQIRTQTSTVSLQQASHIDSDDEIIDLSREDFNFSLPLVSQSSSVSSLTQEANRQLEIDVSSPDSDSSLSADDEKRLTELINDWKKNNNILSDLILFLMRNLFTEEELAESFLIEGSSTSLRKPLDKKKVNMLKSIFSTKLISCIF